MIRLVALAGTVAALAAVLVLALDIRGAGRQFTGLHWGVVAAIAPTAAVSFGMRFWRWSALLGRVAREDIPAVRSFIAFAAGSLLIFTPARVGEVAKSVYARNFFGIPLATSVPVLLAERVTDVAVMSALGLAGLLALSATGGAEIPTYSAGAALLAVLGVLAATRSSRVRQAASRLLGRRVPQALLGASESGGELLRGPSLAVNFSFGVAIWLGEVTIYFLALAALGESDKPELFAVALSVFTLASLGGALSFLPAGLGVTEGGLVGLGVLLGGLSGETALAAALIARAAVLGSVVAFGLCSLPFVRRATDSAASQRQARA